LEQIATGHCCVIPKVYRHDVPLEWHPARSCLIPVLTPPMSRVFFTESDL